MHRRHDRDHRKIGAPAVDEQGEMLTAKLREFQTLLPDREVPSPPSCNLHPRILEPRRTNGRPHDELSLRHPPTAERS